MKFLVKATLPVEAGNANAANEDPSSKALVRRS